MPYSADCPFKFLKLTHAFLFRCFVDFAFVTLERVSTFLGVAVTDLRNEDIERKRATASEKTSNRNTKFAMPSFNGAWPNSCDS
jgi:hypothetical protein